MYYCLCSKEKEKEGWMLCFQELIDRLNTSAFSANGFDTAMCTQNPGQDVSEKNTKGVGNLAIK